MPPGSRMSADGKRIAWEAYVDDRSPQSEVFDVTAGRVVFPKARPSKGLRRRYGRRVLSRDGRSILEMGQNPGTDRIIDVNSEAVVWKSASNEWASALDADGDRFSASETWKGNLFGRDWEYRDWAVRSLKDGSLLFRCWTPPFDGESYANEDGSLFFAQKEREIHRLPYRANWLLLGLCQSVLALPLILLWAVLRWRRKRRLSRLFAQIQDQRM